MELEILMALIGAGGIIVALLGWGLNKLGKFIDSKTNSDLAREAYWRSKDAAMAAVTLVKETYSDKLKEQAEDGKLTKEEAQEAHNRAVKVFKANMGKTVLNALMKDRSPVEAVTMTSAQLENALSAVKARDEAVKKA